MGMLVIYCLKDISLFIPPYGIPEIAAVLFTSAAYLWKRDTSLSVVIGTLLYMLMVQKVF